MTVDPFFEQYDYLRGQGRTHEEALEIVRASIPPPPPPPPAAPGEAKADGTRDAIGLGSAANALSPGRAVQAFLAQYDPPAASPAPLPPAVGLRPVGLSVNPALAPSA